MYIRTMVQFHAQIRGWIRLVHGQLSIESETHSYPLIQLCGVRAHNFTDYCKGHHYVQTFFCSSSVDHFQFK